MSATRTRGRNRDADDTVDLESEKFDPASYINTCLRGKSLQDLVAMRQQVREEHEKALADRRSMVATHLTTFISCKDSVEKLYVSDGDLLRASTLRELADKQKQVVEDCKESFKGLLDRDTVLVDLKHADHVFEKFQFLLSIPETIKRNIEKGEFEQVIFEFKKARHYATRCDETREGAKLFVGVFSEVTELVDNLRTELLKKLRATPPNDVTQTKNHLTTLKNIETPNVLAEYTAIVRARFTADLQASAEVLKSAISHYQAELQRQNEQEQAWRQLKTARSSAALRGLSHVLSQRSRQAVRTPSDKGSKDLLHVLHNVSVTCALSETLCFLKDSGQHLLTHLVPYWQVYQRLWEEREQDEETADATSALFTECIEGYEKYVWPCICHLQPDSTSGASLQQWRGALLSVIRPCAQLLSYTDPNFHKLTDIQHNCQNNFVQQSCGKLTAEIASWAENMEWKVGYYVSKTCPSTELPLKFETAVLDLLNLWDSGDELRQDAQQLLALRDRVFQAHKEFVDLLYHVAFASPKPEATNGRTGRDESALAYYLQATSRLSETGEVTKEERLLMAWADCHALETVVSNNTYETFRNKISMRDSFQAEEKLDFGNSATSIQGTGSSFDLGRTLPSPVSAMVWSPGDGKKNEPSDLDTLRTLIQALKDRIVTGIVSGRMQQISNTICMKGFLRTGINWSYAADPSRIRDYCHDLLLYFVELHEATIRLTKGHATRDILTATFNQTMGVFLHSVRTLDFFNCSELASSNATLQLELEIEFLANCMSGFRSQTWQTFQAHAMEHLMQFYVNTNKETERRKQARNKVFVDTARTKVMIDALKYDPLT